MVNKKARGGGWHGSVGKAKKGPSLFCKRPCYPYPSGPMGTQPKGQLPCCLVFHSGTDPACSHACPASSITPPPPLACLYTSSSSCRAPSSASRMAPFCCCSTSKSSLLTPPPARGHGVEVGVVWGGGGGGGVVCVGWGGGGEVTSGGASRASCASGIGVGARPPVRFVTCSQHRGRLAQAGPWQTASSSIQERHALPRCIPSHKMASAAGKTPGGAARPTRGAARLTCRLLKLPRHAAHGNREALAALPQTLCGHGAPLAGGRRGERGKLGAAHAHRPTTHGRKAAVALGARAGRPAGVCWGHRARGGGLKGAQAEARKRPQLPAHGAAAAGTAQRCDSAARSACTAERITQALPPSGASTPLPGTHRLPQARGRPAQQTSRRRAPRRPPCSARP